MFSLLGNVLAAILGTYIGITNQMADNIAQLFNLETVAVIEEIGDAEPTEPAVVETVLDKLSSSYEFGGSIPDILINSAQFQEAAVLDSVATTGPATNDPGEAIVNIYCTYRTQTHIHTSTGSGFFVSDKGVILTNAHVALFLLLDGVSGYGQTDCSVRTGDIAEATYEVDLLYISPAWIQENADLLRQANPQGTGERDYALLYITEGIDNAPLPSKVPYLDVDTSLLSLSDRNNKVRIGGYPAESLLASGGTTPLYQDIANSTIADLFTFGSNYADVVNLTGSRVGQHGVSGGPVIDASGSVIGMVSTKSDDATLGAGSLSAITLSYIDRTIEEETSFGFTESIGGNLPFRAQVFQSTMVPFLTAILSEDA